MVAGYNPRAAPAAGHPASGGVRPYIAMISKSSPEGIFWRTLRQGAEKAAQDFHADITFEGPDSDQQVDRQLGMLQKALDKKPAAICLAAVDTQAAIPLLQKARDAHIPVISFDSGVDSDIPVTTVATDDIAAAATAADHMARLIGNAGEIAIIAHDQTSSTGINRVKGFTDEIKTKYPNITIAVQIWRATTKVQLIVKTVIGDHPNLKGYFGANQDSVGGLLNAVMEMKKEGQIVVVGFDSGVQQIDAIRSGVEAGAITQDPINMGYKCIEALSR
jgi:ribose transport system substrate-binding protein